VARSHRSEEEDGGRYSGLGHESGERPALSPGSSGTNAARPECTGPYSGAVEHMARCNAGISRTPGVGTRAALSKQSSGRLTSCAPILAAALRAQ